MQRIEHGEKAFAGDAGQAIDALPDELINQDAAAGAGFRGGHVSVLSLVQAGAAILIRRSHAEHGVSKDEATASASWFETRYALLTMKS